MLLQVQESQHLTIRQGLRIMAAEGSVRAYFKGNGTNALKVGTLRVSPEGCRGWPVLAPQFQRVCRKRCWG
jgi:hypothetical protein